MEALLDDRFLAKRPQQQRAKERFDNVLDAAESLLLDVGLQGFSIPVLAERLGYTRASIYKFFPSPYAILNELLQLELKALEESLYAMAPSFQGKEWKELVRDVVSTAVAFHNDRPLSRLLILGGPVSHESYRAQEMNIVHLGSFARQIMAARGVELPTEPDVPTLAVELGTTCMRQSVFFHGRITRAYENEAAAVMIDYLQRYID